MSNDKSASIAEQLSIDAVMNKLQHWRVNKSSYPDTGIPDTIWQMIFALEEAGHRPTALRSLFTLNAGQYAKKREQLNVKSVAKSNNPNQSIITKSPPKVAETVNPATFGEVSIESSASPQSDIPPLTQAATKNRQAVKQLRSNDASPQQYLDTTTIIVECIRPDGHRLKIHTTHHSLNVVMQAFFEQETVKC